MIQQVSYGGQFIMNKSIKGESYIFGEVEDHCLLQW